MQKKVKSFREEKGDWCMKDRNLKELSVKDWTKCETLFRSFSFVMNSEKKPHKKTNNEELGASKAEVQLWAPHHYDELERES